MQPVTNARTSRERKPIPIVTPYSPFTPGPKNHLSAFCLLDWPHTDFSCKQTHTPCRYTKFLTFYLASESLFKVAGLPHTTSRATSGLTLSTALRFLPIPQCASFKSASCSHFLGTTWPMDSWTQNFLDSAERPPNSLQGLGT